MSTFEPLRIRPAKSRFGLSWVGLQPRHLASAASVALCLILAYVLVRRSALAAFALPVAIPIVWLLLRRDAGVPVGIGILLMVPSWETLGTSQVNVLRLASVAALSTVVLCQRRLRWCMTDSAVALLVFVLVGGWLLQGEVPHTGRILSIELTPLGFYIGGRAMSREALPQLLNTVLFAGAVGAITVIYEYTRGHTVFLDPTTYQWDASTSFIFRPGGVFGGPPQASTAMAIAVLLGLAALKGLRGSWLVIGRLCIAICVCALVLTFTRAGLLGLGGGVIVYLWLLRSQLLRPLRVLWTAAVVAVVVFAVLPAFQKSTIVQKGILRGNTFSQREGYWTTALPIALHSAHNLVLGIGTAKLEVATLTPTAVVPSLLAVRPQVFTTSLHSEYVTLLVENGLIGVLVLGFMLGIPTVRAARFARAQHDHAFAAMAVAMVAAGIIMTVGTSLLDGASCSLIFMCAGIAAGAPPPTSPARWQAEHDLPASAHSSR
jgi:O-antigen ligase